MLFGLFGEKTKNTFDLGKHFVRIQFLTEQQKIQKDIAIRELKKQNEGDQYSIIPYSQSYKYSFRYTFKAPFKTNIKLKQVVSHFDIDKGQLGQFMSYYVNKITIAMQNRYKVDFNDSVMLFDERQIYKQRPQDVLQIIYQKKGLWDRIKAGSKKMVKQIPGMIIKIIGKFIQYLLAIFGMSTTGSIVMKFIPIQKILSLVLTVIMVFFPALAPFLGFGKLMI